MDGWPKLPTGIDGFDEIAIGGLPIGRSTLVTGTPGTGKTLFALQFLAAGIRRFDESGVCVTFEERPDDLIRNVQSFGWDLGRLVADGRLLFVDASVDPSVARDEIGAYDLSALLARIENAVRSIGARRVAADAIGTLLSQFMDASVIRHELHRILEALRALGVTTIVTIERQEDDGAIGRLGVEEFVADNVVVMRNRLDQEKRRRTIEILKFRGTPHRRGEYAYTIDSGSGVAVIPPLSERTEPRSPTAVSLGVEELDAMCGRAIHHDTTVLVSGPTGTGKTLLTTHYVQAAVQARERVLLFASEENREQLLRNAASWGADFERAERDGWLRIASRYPEVMALEDHLLQMRREVAAFRPARVAVDSVSAFGRLASPPLFREFVIGLATFVKEHGIAGLFTTSTSLHAGGESVTETHFSSITDAIILLRYVELNGEIRRVVAVLKVRGAAHQKEIREYVIDGSGLHVKDTFRNVHGILTGTPSYVVGEEKSRLDDLFSS